jgi:hypothetical protein
MPHCQDKRDIHIQFEILSDIYRNVPSVELLVAEDLKTAQSHIIEYISWLREKGLSWQTRVIKVAALKHFYATENERVKGN